VALIFVARIVNIVSCNKNFLFHGLPSTLLQLFYFIILSKCYRDNVVPHFNNPEANTNVYLTYLPYLPGDGDNIGLAWIGVVCYRGKDKRANINAYYESDSGTGLVRLLIFLIHIGSNHVEVSAVSKLVTTI
jgi:hypothetical protein